MKKSLVLLTGALLFSSLASAQNTLPLVFGKENTGKAIKKHSTAPAQLSYNNEALPDPFLYQDGTYNADYKGWERHRNETARMVQDYEIGPIPSFKKVTATYNAEEDVIVRLKERAALANRSLNNYVESVLLDVVYNEPNEVTKAAIEEVMSGRNPQKTYTSVDEMFNDILNEEE